ncbi:MAG TPA: LD-carboxypeptidase [Longimicrobium sp.]|nr:LD-carboxypeptidase [Longimicrobium sp.]
MIRPPALRPGARVALVAPAGPLGEGAVERAVERVRAWGFEPVPGEACHGRHGYLSAPDAARAADFNAALRDPSVDAVWSLRGGYGVMRILDAIDWEALVARPKALIGFSDNTALHLAARRLGVVSFHGPHPATVEMNDFAQAGLWRVLTDPAPAGRLPFPEGDASTETITGGVAEGPLVGGNLSLVASTLGTAYAIDAEGALLFLEEVGEPAYRVDRMLTQLRLAGVLDHVAGVVIGGFTETPEGASPDHPAVEEVLRDRLGDLGVPVAVGFPFGHVADNWTLPVGVRARLDAGAGRLEVLEGAVSAGD